MRKIVEAGIVVLGAALFGAVLLPADQDAARFDQPIGGDQAILHALDRLTFGPRPGDLEAVKGMGLRKWIDLQLHPERIPLDPQLEAKTRNLQEPAALLGGAKANKTARPEDLLPPRQIAMLRLGNAQQDLRILSRLPEDKQVEVLAAMPLIRSRVMPLLSPELQAQVQTAVAGPAAPQKLPISAEQAQMLRTDSDQDAMAYLKTLPEDTQIQVLARMPAVRQRLAPMLDPDMQRKVQAAAKNGPGGAGQILAQAKFYRAIESSRQLEEVLADFWYNHFNVDAGKGADRYMVSSYDRDVIRPHVLGKFRDLLEATANSPAMMFYLDNWQSRTPLPPNARRPANPKQADRGLNENYARELMELHTLGVDGGYTQKDVTEVARCFTGWTIQSPRQNATFVYNDRMHDHGEKMVLGVRIPAGGGKSDGEKVLDILAAHPSTARFISKELAQRFVADDPPQALVDRMAKTFRESGGDIRAVLATMIDSPEFFSEGAYRAKLKTPFEMMVSAVRATGASVDNARPLATRIASLGEPLYRKVEPTGYSNLGSEWINSAALMGRMNFAMDLTANKLNGIKVDSAQFPDDPAAAAHSLLFTSASEATLNAISQQADPAVVAGMLLGSPDFQRK